MLDPRGNNSINHLLRRGLYPLPIHAGSLILVFHLLLFFFACVYMICYLLFPYQLSNGRHLILILFCQRNLLRLFPSCFLANNLLYYVFFLFVFPFQLSNTLICSIKSICVLPCLLKVPPFELYSSLFQKLSHLHWKSLNEFIIQRCLGFIFSSHAFPINNLQNSSTLPCATCNSFHNVFSFATRIFQSL